MNDKLHDALQHVTDKYLIEAETYRKRRYPRWTAAVAAVLALMITMYAAVAGMFSATPPMPTVGGTQPADLPQLAAPQSPHTLQLANLVAAPQYPQLVQKPQQTDYENNEDAYRIAFSNWRASERAQYDQPDGYADSLSNFFAESVGQFLNGEENNAYSPVNVYMALAMLAECTDGNSRQQILDLLELDSIDALREQVQHVWNAHYNADGETSLVMANSLWLNEKFTFYEDTLARLANTYYTSSFRGQMGSEAYTNQLRQWLNSQTGGLLEQQVQQQTLTEDTVFAIASTIYFSAGWLNEFREGNTHEAVFHCADKDLLTEFMEQTYMGNYYYGDNFEAAYITLTGSNTMWLILPDEGYTVSDILATNDYMTLVQNPDAWEKQYRDVYITLKVPKFDVTGDLDLVSGLQNMGITDVFQDTVSDFSPISPKEQLYVNAATHAARVRIDEEGCVGTAFTILYVYATGGWPTEKPQQINFTLDRPFLFIVSSRDQLPLFAGVVAQP